MGLGLLIGLVLAIPALRSYLFDDAYIHARIARNFVELGLPVYNDGDVFKVGSSTGYVLLVGSLSRLFDPIAAIRGIEAACIALTTSGLFYLAAMSGRLWTAMPVVLLMLPSLLLAAYGGMETPILCLLLTMAAIAHVHGRAGIMIALVAAGTWFRFEIFILLGIMILFSLIRRDNRAAALGCLIATVIVTVDYHFFGSIIPYAAKVKSVAYALTPYESVRQVFKGETPLLQADAVRFALVGVSLLSLAINNGLIARRWRSAVPADGFMVFALAMLAAWLTSKSLIFAWYYPLFVFPFALWLITRQDALLPAAGVLRRVALTASLIVMVAFGGYCLEAVRANQGLGNGMPPDRRVEFYRAIGAGLYAQCRDCTLASSEIGGLGYSFRGRVYDGFGLTDPAAAKYHPMKVPAERASHMDGAIPPGYVRERDPDFIVTMPRFATAVAASPVSDQYRRYFCPFSTDRQQSVWGDTGLDIYSRRALGAGVLLSSRCSQTH